MTLTIYNTKTRRKEPFHTITPHRVSMYVCGITAYDYCHIGHARSALVFDMIYRYLQAAGYEVTFVRNFTDIDDKIINRANELQVDAMELARRFIEAFHADMDALGVARPTHEPLATDHIPEIIAMIRALEEKGMAYEVEGDVYFSVERLEGYGELSGRKLDEMQAGARVEVDVRKRNPMDFALWKKAKPGEPTWDSPWGPGRPGWHIECSAMSRKYLGDVFDIHGGGKDLTFPHHENELAQSRGATGREFVHYWVHNGFVTIRDEKMSKSLGNFFTIRQVLEKFRPEALRIFILSSHYRSPLNYSEAALHEAEAGLDRLYGALAEVAGVVARRADMAIGSGASVVGRKQRTIIEELEGRFFAAMDNDFNSAAAIGHLFEAVKVANSILRALPPAPLKEDLTLLQRLCGSVVRCAGILGLLQQDPDVAVARREEMLLAELGKTKEEVTALVQARNEARARKDWAESDRIRDRLTAMGIELHDSAEGTGWAVRALHG